MSITPNGFLRLDGPRGPVYVRTEAVQLIGASWDPGGGRPTERVIVLKDSTAAWDILDTKDNMIALLGGDGQ